MADLIVPDVIADVRAWLRSQPSLAALHGGRVFYRVPDPAKVGGWPLLRLYRLGGGIIEEGGDTTTSQVDLSIEVWHNQTQGYTTVRQLALLLESVIKKIPAGTVINPAGSTVVLSGHVTNTIDSPDPDSGWPRMVADSRWVVQGI